MAKKTKIVKTSAKVSQQPVAYQGKVTLKLQKGGHTIKTYKTSNSGTILLFTGIARFLSGQFNSELTGMKSGDISGYIPQYLGLGYESTPTVTDTLQYSLKNEYKINRIRVERQNIKIDSNSKSIKLPLVATVYYSEIGSRRITELGLFSTPANGTNTLLARVNIPAQDGGLPGIELAVGMNLLVE
ncbi:hypothetical protein [uncultured Clostridium sp.]|uniref:hypothetical protein n=1 Tax=uncultured Clostridium sp. TaxID=59620 RepID=UPI00262C5540|nr:hypothetical protein [uncultured Clostridium sp.]